MRIAKVAVTEPGPLLVLFQADTSHPRRDSARPKAAWHCTLGDDESIKVHQRLYEPVLILSKLLPVG